MKKKAFTTEELLDLLDSIRIELSKGDSYYDEQCLQQRNYVEGAMFVLESMRLATREPLEILPDNFVPELLSEIGPY